jgi:hypothetical protein
MRTCKRCWLDKAHSEFKKRGGKRSGEWDPWCKTCHVSYTAAWRLRNKAKVKAQRWGYLDRERARIRKVKRAYYERNKEKYRKWAREVRARNPMRTKAHKAVAVAIKNGSLVRLPCARCGSPRADAHHPDYAKPLDVIWVCRICHERLYHHGET